MSRRRIMVVITYGFSVRYLWSTGVLDKLSSSADPVVALGWDDPELESLLVQAGFEVVRAPDARLSPDYRRFRRKIGLVHAKRLNSPTTAIKRNRARTGPQLSQAAAKRELRRLVENLEVTFPKQREALEALEPEQVEHGTNVAEFRAFLDRCRVDVVVSVTPYHDQDALLLWAAQQHGLRTLTSIISFDNPTTRDRMITRSDRILVWNRYNAAEVTRAYDDVSDGTVGVIGAPQFDLHHRADLVTPDDEWRRSLGLPVDRPIILYGAGPSVLVPREPDLVSVLDQAIVAGKLPGKPFLLVRRHPVDPPSVWKNVADELQSGLVTDPWAAGENPMRSWPSEADIKVQMSTLAHTAVHVNICSSMTIDGAIFDRPQIGPTFVPGASKQEQRRVLDFYRQEHWQPIAHSGGLVTAGNPGELLGSISAALEEPERLSEPRARLVDEVLTFRDGRSSQRLVDAVVAQLA